MRSRRTPISWILAQDSRGFASQFDAPECHAPVAPASCRLSRGRPALGAAGETPAATAAGTAALPGSPPCYISHSGSRFIEILLSRSSIYEIDFVEPMEQRLILINLLIKLGVAASAASILGRSVEFKSLLFQD